jgi:zinc transport system permease protein
MMGLEFVYQLIGHLFPFDFMQQRFMQQAMVALIILVPMTSAMGVHVVNMRMAFFSDAISHSVFAGIALGLIMSINTEVLVPIFCLIIGIGVIYFKRKSALSTDTVIGVVFSAVVAFGLAIISRDRSAARNIQALLYGDILSITDADILILGGLLVVFVVFQVVSFNKMLHLSVNEELASAHGVNTGAYQYVFAAMLSLLVAFSVRAAGVLLVTALLIVPAAAAKNLSRSAAQSQRWAILIGIVSAVAGLLISAQNWANTATGATVILCAFVWFILSLVFSGFIKRK